MRFRPAMLALVPLLLAGCAAGSARDTAASAPPCIDQCRLTVENWTQEGLSLMVRVNGGPAQFVGLVSPSGISSFFVPRGLSLVHYSVEGRGCTGHVRWSERGEGSFTASLESCR